MFTQLNPTIPLHVLEKGDGYAIGMIDYGQEHNLIWVTVLNDSGEIWCAPNPSVRLGQNWTMGRKQNALIEADRVAAAEPCDDSSQAITS
ncbi:hypothetical protein HNO88_002811 [Novosphingobium chloroacetimidivorans]|uniref:Uncharacterized protein n=1 Tax=Novosphingobium chloroacetimidivorans TaxID=1428314 RepID=A0A7W7KAZ2_9SPHN|nr:hypothetical protein [Novosphingobium chloroacetimidivorans]MBB4859482.1 hypothetical protein [Novosphingobium chloroacetimidivorans]